MNPLTTPALAKLIGGLSLALLLSLGGNVFFIWHSGKKSGEAKSEAERKTLAANVAALQIDAAVTTALSKRAKEDNAALMQDLEDIAVRGRETITVYRTIAAKAPLALVCAPGKERMDAVNKGLGAK